MSNACWTPRSPCGGGLGWGDVAVCEMRDDDVVDAFDIAEHLVVPESQDAKTLALQPRRSRIVLDNPTVMLPAIDLDNEAPIEADDRHLSAETMTVDLFEAKLRPEALFSLGGIAPQLTRA
jgi:hypothetical protein